MVLWPRRCEGLHDLVPWLSSRDSAGGDSTLLRAVYRGAGVLFEHRDPRQAQPPAAPPRGRNAACLSLRQEALPKQDARVAECARVPEVLPPRYAAIRHADAVAPRAGTSRRTRKRLALPRTQAYRRLTPSRGPTAGSHWSSRRALSIPLTKTF